MKQLRKNNYSRFLIRNLARYGLTALLGIVLVGESVIAIPRNTRVDIAQQEETTPNQGIRKQAERLTIEGLELAEQGNPES